MRSVSVLVVFAAAAVGSASAFAPPSAATTRRALPSATGAASSPLRFLPTSSLVDDAVGARKSVTTALNMGYSLPPSPGGGGGGGPGDDLKALVPGVLTILGLVAFFASPLGSIFFFLTNSLLTVALLTPVVLWVGFQGWQAFNTAEGPCPNCGSPIRTLKEDGGNPTICFSCGSLVRRTMDGDGFELCNNPESMYSQDENGGFGGGLFEDLFGGAGGGGGGFSEEVTTTTTTTTVEDAKKKKKTQTERQRTVIDVEVEKE